MHIYIYINGIPGNVVKRCAAGVIVLWIQRDANRKYT